MLHIQIISYLSCFSRFVSGYLFINFFRFSLRRNRAFVPLRPPLPHEIVGNRTNRSTIEDEDGTTQALNTYVRLNRMEAMRQISIIHSAEIRIPYKRHLVRLILSYFICVYIISLLRLLFPFAAFGSAIFGRSTIFLSSFIIFSSLFIFLCVASPACFALERLYGHPASARRANVARKERERERERRDESRRGKKNGIDFSLFSGFSRFYCALYNLIVVWLPSLCHSEPVRTAK